MYILFHMYVYTPSYVNIYNKSIHIQVCFIRTYVVHKTVQALQFRCCVYVM